jgi:hypothetical protein
MKEGETIKNVGRCGRCGRFLIEEEFGKHECDLKTTASQDIVVDHLELGKRDSEGHRLLVAEGLDGVPYWLIECKHNPPHGTKRNFTGNGTKQEGNVTLNGAASVTLPLGIEFVPRKIQR